MKAKNALSLVLAAGVVTPALADVSPTIAPRGTMAEKEIAHIYYNIATGEKVATLLGDVRPSDNGVSPAVWVAENTLPCASFGQTGGTAGVVDSPACTTCFTSTATGQIFLDWGDVPTDQVVDCVGISWATQVLDVDLDGDGVGDGVEGFGASYAWFDAENGFDSSATRLDANGFTFFNLPGDTNFMPGFLAVYTATVDLAATFTSSIVFELGDTDSVDGSGTGLFNPGSGADLDSDGLADFGYAIQYIQPGTVDFDGDGNPDGDPLAAALTAWSLVTGNGDIGTDGSYIPETDVPGAQGIEDAFDIFIDFDSDGVLEPIGTFFYGGFACVGATGNTPFAQFRMALYGPGGEVPCPADIFPAGGGDGLLNFFDINAFLTAFNTGDLSVADVFPAGGGDGLLNFFDINAYLTSFNAGCP
jgi:hypothetical protein